MARPQQSKVTIKHELLGIALIAMGALAWISLTSIKAGKLGMWLAEAFRYLAGQGSSIFPFLIALIGLRLLINRPLSNDLSKINSMLALIIALLSFLHVGLTPESYYLSVAKGVGGGFIGYLGALILTKAFGLAGAYIVLASTALASILVITNSSLVVITGVSSKKILAFWQKTRQDLTEFIFEAVNEHETADPEENHHHKTNFDSTTDKSNWNLQSLTNGKGIIDFAKSTVADVVETVQPKINVYPSAWDDSKQDIVTERTTTRAQSSIDHTSEAWKTVETPNEQDKRTQKKLNKVAPEELIEVNFPQAEGYKYPAISLLARPTKPKNVRLHKDITENIKILEETLENFGVKAKVTEVSRGPAITRYEVQPAAGVKVSRIVNLADDLALSMAATDVRIEAPIPGKAAVGIEVPNKEISPVYLREIIEAPEFANASSRLTVALGKDIAGAPIFADLAKMPHMLIAGSTGSGKSVCMNSLITSILFKASPQEVKFLMIDPKMVELTTYNGIPHLIAPVVTDPKKAAGALRWVVREMEDRYTSFAAAGVKNLAGFNELRLKLQEKTLPQIVVLIDELADLMMVAPADVEDAICRLAQMARAAGIHLVVATQRPSVDVITGLIKANIPSRVAFAVSSQIDSRTILDMAGAEKLLGKGDMLFFPVGIAKPTRVQGVFVSEKEVEDVVEFLKLQGLPEYAEGVTKVEDPKSSREDIVEDDLLPEAAKLMIECGQASISMLQRRFRIGYARAARIMDIMESKGIVGGYEGSKPRNVFMTLEQWEDEFGERADQ